MTQEAEIMAIPINFARRRNRHGVLENGRVERQMVGVTRGEGSLLLDQAQWAVLVRSG